MSKSKPKPIVILCEDVAQQDFLKALVNDRGWTNREIDLAPLAVVKGKAGNDYVLSHYAGWAGRLRGRWMRGLVVAIDADEYSVDCRYRQLDDKLKEAKSLKNAKRQPRQSGEHIAIFVPKRHIETWIEYLLNGGSVSEHKRSPLHDNTKPLQRVEAANRFLKLAPPAALPTNCPPSLRRGLTELPRIPEK